MTSIVFIVLYAIAIIAVGALGTQYVIGQSKQKISISFNEKLDKAIKILAIVFVCLSFIDIFLPDAFSLRYIEEFDLLKANHNSFHAICRALNAIAVVLLPIVVFFKKKSLNKIVAWIMLPTVILNMFCFNDYMYYFTSEMTFTRATVFGEALWPTLTNFYFRAVFFSILMLIELVICAYTVVKNIEDLGFENKNQVFTFIALFIGLFFTNMPIYTIQQFFGETAVGIPFHFLDPSHIAFMLFIPLEGVVLWLIFRNKSSEDKYILMLIMSISLMFQYNTFFKTDGIIVAKRYPFQLCNIAGAFLIITLITKSEKMFHFTVVVNVTGALIAIIMCDSTPGDVGFFYCMNIHYMVEHINVFLVPILCLVLKVFKPLKLKDIKHFIIGFAIYYVAILIIGTIFNGINAKTGNDYFYCNYLFMFSKETAMGLAGNWVGALFDIKFTIAQYYTFTLAQVFVYVIFMVICSGIFFALYGIFKEKENINASIK